MCVLCVGNSLKDRLKQINPCNRGNQPDGWSEPKSIAALTSEGNLLTILTSVREMVSASIRVYREERRPVRICNEIRGDE